MDFDEKRIAAFLKENKLDEAVLALIRGAMEGDKIRYNGVTVSPDVGEGSRVELVWRYPLEVLYTLIVPQSFADLADRLYETFERMIPDGQGWTVDMPMRGQFTVRLVCNSGERHQGSGRSSGGSPRLAVEGLRPPFARNDAPPPTKPSGAVVLSRTTESRILRAPWCGFSVSCHLS